MPRSVKQTRPRSVRTVYEKLRDMIVHSALAPGAPLIERPLAERLGVSRASLRAALQRLQHEGFVHPAAAGQYSRAVVAPLTVRDMEEIYTLIAVLNGAAARQAAALPEAERHRVTDAMQTLNDELRLVLAAPAEELGRIYDIDHRFHRVYVDAAAGARLRGLLDAMDSQGERYGRAYASGLGHAAIVRGPASTSPAEHQAIVDAIRSGGADAAEQAAVSNWRNAAARLRQVMEHAGERGSY